MIDAQAAGNLLSRLEGVRKNATGWSARCPAHDDQNASLSIGNGEGGKLLVHCHAGCETSDVLRSVQMTVADLMPPKVLPKKRRTLGKVVAEYSYHNADGTLLYQSCRTDPKDFYARRPDGKGGWINNLDGVHRALYHENLIRGSDTTATVWIPEGEKDCDRICQRGMVATCNVGGAKKWRDEYNEVLRGRSVVILPDNDKTGRDHAERVAQSLFGVAASVKVLTLPGLPQKGDVSDWFDAGGTREALEALANEVPEWTAENSCQLDLQPNGNRPRILNAERVGAGEDAELHVRPLANIIDQIKNVSGGWPRRVGNSLFIDDADHGLHQFAKPADLFGWLHSKAAVSWHRSPSCVSQAELFCELQRTAEAYEAIEAYPHFPPLAGHYYSHRKLEAGDGETLRNLVGRFCPATPIDGDLIQSLFASAAWGGAGGTRPAYVVVSDDGRGVGKSKLIEIVGMLFGGFFAINAEERAADIAKRLLTPEAATKRITLFDNVKTNRLSWGEYESLITCRDISGHRLYAGERTRPNTLLWCLTLNGPSMSRDMAQRSVIIKLKRPEHSATWEDAIKAFVEENRWQIMADLAAFFLGPATTLARHTRWGSWEREVLARLPEPGEAQRVILERQGAVNADDEESLDVADYFRQQLERLGYSPDVDSVHIPNELAREWFNRATGTSTTTTGVSRAIRQAHDEGSLPNVAQNPCRTYGRGFVWSIRRDSKVHYDIEDRQREQGWQENRHWDR